MVEIDFEDTDKMVSFRVDKKLWRKFHSLAVLEDKKIQVILYELIENFVKGKEKKDYEF